jgi:7,8-dihydropterin-6-yl-methyl-4-(beta-D-ribofuranosyl)aminobenzene 5'-phosphate synthase
VASQPDFDRPQPVGKGRNWTVAVRSLIVCTIMVVAIPGPATGRGAGERRSASAAGGQSEGETGRVQTLEVTILSTMLADRAGVGEWGFSALVETNGHRILFDTGSRPETVLQNARELKIDLSGVNDVVLSHHHGDHVGGLLTLRRELAKQKPDALKRAFVGAGIFLSRPGPQAKESNEALLLKKQYEELGGSFDVIDRPREILPGVWLTGPVPRVHPERNWSLQRTIRNEDGSTVEDNVPEDMSLVIDSDKGLVVISGCGHAGIINTLEYARSKVRACPVHAALGGFHLFEADTRALDWTAGELRAMGIERFLGAHCTGIEAVFGLRQRLELSRSACAVGAVGARFSLKSGIDPGAIAR